MKKKQLTPEAMLKEAYARESRECPRCKTGHDMQKKVTLKKKQLSPEAMLKEAYARESRECPRCKTGHDMPFTCERSLQTCPSVFSLVLAWASPQASDKVLARAYTQTRARAHTHTHARTLASTHTHTHTLSLSLFFHLSLSLFLTHTGARALKI